VPHILSISFFLSITTVRSRLWLPKQILHHPIRSLANVRHSEPPILNLFTLVILRHEYTTIRKSQYAYFSILLLHLFLLSPNIFPKSPFPTERGELSCPYAVGKKVWFNEPFAKVNTSNGWATNMVQFYPTFPLIDSIVHLIIFGL